MGIVCAAYLAIGSIMLVNELCDAYNREDFLAMSFADKVFIVAAFVLAWPFIVEGAPWR